jgi:hypothetical protein
MKEIIEGYQTKFAKLVGMFLDDNKKQQHSN